ncbi:SDR family NAD(P)-dependent oxidoreductase [Exiguobacterium aestuarii]|uniref:SDR family NAD(P)-dependent oxidoreductase n=1 Tax=Exiguobacterium aestuarii TaxID=273527 RepID=UPI001CD255DB|nr:SDR family oxidoreductase [Exiguobacterium aestuarii]MCA0981333.1 SDR family oxidoreductase [Exiguobacterium aestuarii]
MSMKTAVIIGAGPGIGLHTAEQFAKNGYQIALLARNADRLADYESQLVQKGYTAKGFEADTRSEADLQLVMGQIHEMFGSIDTVVYNAMAATPGRPTTLTSADVIRDFEVNVLGALMSARFAAPYMDGGSILLTGGGLALYPSADYASLAIGKAALRNLAYSLHEELADSSIYVGTLTIKGFVQEGTYFAPERIAEALYDMHVQQTEVERMYEEEQA